MSKLNNFSYWFIFFFSFFSILSCSPLKGKYCYSSGNYECIEFKRNHTFNYNYWIDTGSDKGCGTYEITDSEVILNFNTPPFIKDIPKVDIQKLELNLKADTLGIRYNKIQNFISIVCLDKKTKNAVTVGEISYQGLYPIQFGTQQFFKIDTIKFNITELDFPIMITIHTSTHLSLQFTLQEKAQYLIIAELINNQGYNLMSGQKIFKRENFISKKTAAKWIEKNSEIIFERKLFVKSR